MCLRSSACPPTPTLKHPRADVSLVDEDECQTHLDLTIVSATSQQALQAGASSKVGVAAKQSERAKKSKYDPHLVTPLVLESGGRAVSEFSQFIKDLLPIGHTRSTVAQQIWQSIAVALQRANARAVLQAQRAWRLLPQPILS